VRHRAGGYRTNADGETGGEFGGKTVSWPVFVLIPIALIAFVSGQLFLKRAMESSRLKGFRDAKVITFLGCGIFSMAIHFFVTLGLLGHLDLSYVYPFQGLSVVIISLAAAIVLREKLNLRLTLGALLISAGIVLVSMS
jgi:undecaprenyl phosphate-alpha-L-ara4N flippase subunit ArnE